MGWFKPKIKPTHATVPLNSPLPRIGRICSSQTWHNLQSSWLLHLFPCISFWLWKCLLYQIDPKKIITVSQAVHFNHWDEVNGRALGYIRRYKKKSNGLDFYVLWTLIGLYCKQRKLRSTISLESKVKYV
jgi:hypothetical protein